MCFVDGSCHCCDAAVQSRWQGHLSGDQNNGLCHGFGWGWGRWPNSGLESVILPNHLGIGTDLSFLWLSSYHPGLGGLAVKDCATLTNPWRESVSDSHAWHCRARCIDSFVDALGALKASKSLLLIHLKQECSPVFYIGE